MLRIKNKENLRGKKVFIHNIRYWVEGVYEYPNDYQIHLRSSDKTKPDEVLILRRNKKESRVKGVIYKYYEIWNVSKPHNKAGLTDVAIRDMYSVIHAIEHIMNKEVSNPQTKVSK